MSNIIYRIPLTPTPGFSYLGTPTAESTNVTVPTGSLIFDTVESGSSILMGTNTADTTYGVGTGATASLSTKNINIGTSGVSGSTTNINIGSAVNGSTTNVNLNGVVTISDTLNLSGDLIPDADVTYDIGSENLRWRDLYLSGDTIYLGGTPVSVGDGKLIVGNNIVSTSIPQLNWTAVTLDESILPQVSRFGIVAAGGGTFIATNYGFNDSVYSTDGGLTWTLFELPYTPASNLQIASTNPLAYGNGIWLLAFSQTTQRQTATSPDGINWTVHPEVLPNENPNAELDPLHEWMGVIFSDKFVMFSSGVRSVQNSGFPRIISSPDGINWTGHNPILDPETNIPVAPSIGYNGTGPWYMTGLAWGNNTYVGIGQGYNTVGGGIAGNQFYYSTTLDSWQQVIVPVSAEWRKIQFGNGAFIAFAYFPYAAVRSTDNGLTWEEITLPLGIVDIKYGQGRWIAITGNTFDNQGQHAYSLDNGTTWVAFDMPTVANLYGYSALAFNGTTFCAVGGGGGYFGGEVIAISTITTDAVEQVCCYNDADVAAYLPTHTGNISGNGAQLTGLTATMVGLGNVTNESKATMFTSPTFTGTVSDEKGSIRALPQNARTSAYTLVLADVGKHISITTGGVTVPSGIFSIGDSITIYNNSNSAQTITQGGSVTMYQAGTTNTGNRTLNARGLATVLCVAVNTFVITGAGLI